MNTKEPRQTEEPEKVHDLSDAELPESLNKESSEISSVTVSLEKASLLEQKRPIIVFDIDNTLIKIIEEPYEDTGEFLRIYVDLRQYGGPNGPMYHWILPGTPQLLRYVIVEKQLPVAFFSYGPRERNEAIVPVILQRVFPDSYQTILSSTMIFSRHHFKTDYGKDLTVVAEAFEAKFNETVSIENIILIDDNKSESINGQNFIHRKTSSSGVDVIKLLEEMFSSGKTPSEFLSERAK